MIPLSSQILLIFIRKVALFQSTVFIALGESGFAYKTSSEHSLTVPKQNKLGKKKMLKCITINFKKQYIFSWSPAQVHLSHWGITFIIQLWLTECMTESCFNKFIEAEEDVKNRQAPGNAKSGKKSKYNFISRGAMA